MSTHHHQLHSSAPTLADTCGGSQLFLFMTLIETLFRSQSDIMDTVCDPPAIERPDDEYDFIVVGAGSAGCVVAARLTENPDFRVLLIEAGGPEPLGIQVPAFQVLFFNSSVDWQYRTEPNGRSYLSTPEEGGIWTRGKMLGGTSTLNGMSYLRGNPADFDRWSALGNPGWDFESVLPFFRRSEANINLVDCDEARLHGTEGPVPVEFGYEAKVSDEFLRAARELGMPVLDDMNGEQQSGFSAGQSTWRNGVRRSMARAFLGDVWGRPNFHLWLNTRVTRLVLDNDYGDDEQEPTATGVEVIDRHGRVRTVRARKEVIVCAGTVESPKLLMLSGIGASEELLEVGVEPVVELPGVGKNLLNHIAHLILFNVQRPNRNYLNEKMVKKYLRYRQGPLAASIIPVLAKFASRYADGDHDPDCQLYMGDDIVFPQNVCSRDGSAAAQRQNEILFAMASMLHTKSRGHLRLASADPQVPPLIYPNLLSHPDDLERLLESIAMVQRLMLETSVFRPYNVTMVPALGTPCMQLEIGTPEYWRCAVRYRTEHIHHQVGTCRMGPRDDEWLSVVDAELCVYGVRNLRVMDASVMPTPVSGNPNAATVMIGEKGVDAVRTRWEVEWEKNIVYE